MYKLHSQHWINLINQNPQTIKTVSNQEILKFSLKLLSSSFLSPNIIQNKTTLWSTPSFLPPAYSYIHSKLFWLISPWSNSQPFQSNFKIDFLFFLSLNLPSFSWNIPLSPILFQTILFFYFSEPPQPYPPNHPYHSNKNNKYVQFLPTLSLSPFFSKLFYFSEGRDHGYWQ